MLVSLKNLQDEIFTVEIEPSQTVKSLKELIEKEKGDKFPAKTMKLMYAGKFLVDNKKVSDYNVEEKKFVIVFVKKPKAAKAAKGSEAEAESSSGVDDSAGASISEERAATEALIQHIIELGFSREDVVAALCASYNNPDRAVEFLINRVFPNATSESDEAEARRREYERTTDPDALHLLRELGNAGGITLGSENLLPCTYLPSNNAIMGIFSRAVDESDSQTRAADRELEQDQELINKTYAEMESTELAGSSSSSTRSAPASSSMPDSSMFSSDTLFNIGNALGNVTDAQAFGLVDTDHAAIERLKQLGFSNQKAIEAYFVCERNENAAADFLFSQKLE